MILNIVKGVSSLFATVGKPKPIVDFRKESPYTSSKFRGKHEIDTAICTGCSACSKICPVDAIEMVATGVKKPSKTPEVSMAICIFCGLCEDSCPTKPKKAIKLSGGTYKLFSLGDKESQKGFIVRGERLEVTDV